MVHKEPTKTYTHYHSHMKCVLLSIKIRQINTNEAPTNTPELIMNGINYVFMKAPIP